MLQTWTSTLYEKWSSARRKAGSLRGTDAARWSTRGVLAGWIFTGVMIIFVSQLCNTIWAFANPAPHHWDNADYLNLAYKDYWSYDFGGPVVDPQHHPGVKRTGVLGVWDSLLHNDANRPPGQRLLSMPFIFIGTGMLPTLRTVSLMFFWVTLWLIYKTVKTVVPGPNGIAAGIAAIIVLSIALEVGWSIRVFGTEYPLYFSVALMLYAMARGALAVQPTHRTWILLGVSLGLGMLSKISFVMLAGPVGIVAMSMALTGRLPGLRAGRLLLAAVLGALICFPFYRYHIFTVLKYGQEMTEFKRHSLNKTGIEFVHAWLSLHFNEGLGAGASAVSVVLFLLGIPTVVKWTGANWRPVRTGRPVQFSPAGVLIMLSLSAGLPLPLFQTVFSQSANHRHITPAYFPLTVSIAVAAGTAGTLVAWWSWPILLAIALPAHWQVSGYPRRLLRYLNYPGVFVEYSTTPDDVWDWEPLHEMIKDRKIKFPYIGRVGNGGQFNEPSIQAPWFSRGDWANCTWLWKPDFGPYNFSAVRQELEHQQDGNPVTVVVTAPIDHVRIDGSMLPEGELADNAQNKQFADDMMKLSDWELIGKFPIGRVNPAEIWVFARKSAITGRP